MLKLLQANPALRLAVQSHTDHTSPPARNQPLSKTRALAVVMALTAEGILPDRLQAVGFGQTRPLTDNATGVGRAQNCRLKPMKR